MKPDAIVREALTRQFISESDRDTVYAKGGRPANVLKDAINNGAVTVASSSDESGDGDGYDWSNLPMINRRG